MLMEVIKLDMIFSVGSACRPAYHLQVNGLRRFACPLDWQMRYSLDRVLHLFQTSFQDFFEVIEEEQALDCHCRKVWDKKNGICSIHHFSKDLDLETSHVMFREKMARRYYNLDAEIKKSNVIGLICNRKHSIIEFIEFLKAFSQIYPQKKIILINIRDEDINEKQRVRHVVDENLEIHEYIFCDKDKLKVTSWKGNKEGWDWVLSHYEMPNTEEFECFIKQAANRDIIIYGAGEAAQVLLKRLERNGLSVSGFAITNMTGNPENIKGIKVQPVDVYRQEDTLLIVAVKDTNIRKEMLDYVKERAYKVAYFDTIFGEIRFAGEDLYDEGFCGCSSI